MKRTLFYLLLLFSINSFSQIIHPVPDYNSPYQYIDNLCYTENFKERIKVANLFNQSTLSLNDKLKFKITSYTQIHHEYINEEFLPVHDIKYIYHDNLLPKWVYPPDLVKFDDDGIKSYFLQNNPILHGGWAGAYFNQDNWGSYVNDPRTGENYYWMQHTPKSLLAYNGMKQDVLQYGYLSTKHFAIPTALMLQSFSQSGYTVVVNTTFIKVSNSYTRLTWKLDTYEFIIETLSNNTVISTIITKYKWNEFFNEYLKYLEIITKPSVFENGDCYEIVIEKSFGDYSNLCTDWALDRNMTNQIGLPSSNIEIFPNPVVNNLTLKVPLFDGETLISIYNMNGALVSYDNISSSINVKNIDINALIPGIYLINVIQGNNVKSSKFVKL